MNLSGIVFHFPFETIHSVCSLESYKCFAILMYTDSQHMSHVMRKPVFGFPTKSDTNMAVQPPNMVRDLQILDLGSNGIV